MSFVVPRYFVQCEFCGVLHDFLKAKMKALRSKVMFNLCKIRENVLFIKQNLTLFSLLKFWTKAKRIYKTSVTPSVSVDMGLVNKSQSKRCLKHKNTRDYQFTLTRNTGLENRIVWWAASVL
jgi:hypothetical protein